MSTAGIGGSPPSLGGPTPAGRIIGPALDKIVKNAAWRKHSALVSACKAALDLLSSTIESTSDPVSPLVTLPASTGAACLRPLSAAASSADLKLADASLHCALALFSRNLLLGPVHSVLVPDSQAVVVQENEGYRGSLISDLIASVCSCCGLGDEGIEILALRVIVAAVRSPAAGIRRDAIVHLVKSCYNVYLGSSSLLSQLCAKAALALVISVVFARAEADNVLATGPDISAVDLLDLSDRSLNDCNLVQSAQNFINEAMQLGGYTDGEVVAAVGCDEVGENGISVVREDAIFVFRNLCKFSMKFATPDNPDDPLLLRGKILSLELLKMVIENAGPVWQSNDKFVGAIKQYLCLSLLKNSALSVMSIFQLLCSIFTGLLSKFRSGLKEEIGIFFPMLVSRVIENVLQPSFLQKMTVLNFLEKMCQDSQITIDIFVNYDCDVDAPNIFERIVNGLLKTALGVPPGSVTTLSPAQDSSFRFESVKCLASIIKSMGLWMDQQLHIGDYSPKAHEAENSTENHVSINGEDVAGTDYELHSDNNNAATLEQRWAYKLELQKGIALFNRKPSKGIEFLINTKKIGSSPEDVASFLRTTSGLNETMIGDYLGEREDFPLKVMHAYVDSMNFERMTFGGAIRFFLRGFRLPGEAQKIDRIMEKFAERYCKCNPDSFTTADTAYVLAYSVIMLNTDAHNSMVKDKMSKADFIRNNRGINDGKDLAEDFLGSLYDDIVKNEIKMNADSSAPQNKQANSLNKLLGLDNILNLVNWKHSEEKALGTSDMLIKHIQEQFKAKSCKSESTYYTITDTAILRFMMEACWAPMMAAFSVTLDQSGDNAAASYCLQGFRHAVHVTAVMCMQTQRDAFVTSVAKFTYLHNAADMKQKNVDAMKAIISIAIEDGNYLQESWEHVLTCLSRFEQLHLLGEGAPTDASFFTVPSTETEEKSQKSPKISSSKKKGDTLQSSAVMAVVRGGSYDSTALGTNSSGLVTPEQINNFISNLHLLDQIGTFEINQIFAHSQRLNSDAIVAFVRALCKVSMAELQSPKDPRVFSLTKIVEIAHYNMNRIRLVWSRIWNVLSDYFVSVGLSENLSVAIFSMDALRQLAMKFLEREELANYNFQNEFLRPFVVVMQKSTTAEIRELIVRCVSQMVLTRVSNVKSGWKSVFMVYTTAAADDRKSIVLLAFETMEKIVRDYFPYITETETTTFTDCVKCLITFTKSKFNNDASLNAIAFLRYCAVKLAEGGVVCYDKNTEENSANGDGADASASSDIDDHVYFWVPLLAGLSNLTSDPRPTIRKGALEVLFDILKDHGHLFSRAFWDNILRSVIYPIFSSAMYGNDNQAPPSSLARLEDDFWHPDTDPIATQCLVDLFLKFVHILRSQLENVVAIITSFIRSPYHKSATMGVNAFMQLIGVLGHELSNYEWEDIFLSLKEAAKRTLSELSTIIMVMNNIEIPESAEVYSDAEQYSDQGYVSNEEEDSNMETASYAVVRMKGHIAVELLIVQTIMRLYEAHHESMSTGSIRILVEIISSIVSYAREVRNEKELQLKLRKTCSLLEVSDPPVVHFENEVYQNYLKFLQTLHKDRPLPSEELGIEGQLVDACESVLQIYLTCAGCSPSQHPNDNPTPYRTLPLGSAKKEELAARTNLLIVAVRVLSSLETESFKRNLPRFFPSLVNLIRSEHSSGAVQFALLDIFQSSIGPIILSQ